MDEPTKQLTNREYWEYLKLKEKACPKRPRRLPWFLLGLVVGVLLAILVTLILGNLNMNVMWLIR